MTRPSSSVRRILHCLRAPVGGLFRHVQDLAREQAKMGHAVGIVCDERTGGAAAEQALRGLADVCSLGVSRIAMPRQPGFGDWRALRHVTRLARAAEADVLHGHGAKGGAYARLAGYRLKRGGMASRVFYTPHGGSLHYQPDTLAGRFYIAAERRLAPFTDGIIFESSFAEQTYRAMIGQPSCPTTVVHNGLHPHEFYDAEVDVDAADFVFIGELRQLKGVDLLIEALAAVQAGLPAGHRARAVIVGGGRDEAKFKRLAKRRRLASQIAFTGPMRAGRAFARGRCVVVPSRAESFPYIVLEAVAARMPLIATRVGGIPEITAGVPMPLVPAGDMPALAAQMQAFLLDPGRFAERAAALQAMARQRFMVTDMAEQIDGFYREVAGGESVQPTKPR